MRNAMIAACLMLAVPAVHGQDVETLERQLDKAREAAPLTIRNFMLVSRPAKYFGDYEMRQGNDYGRGEKLHFYAEPRNLTMARNSAGVFEPALEVDIEVAPEKGEVHKQPKFMVVKIPSRSRIQDLYLNMTVSLGASPPGNYRITFVVRDVNSKKSATASQAVVIK